jgi:antirestriction protein ArdC
MIGRGQGARRCWPARLGAGVRRHHAGALPGRAGTMRARYQGAQGARGVRNFFHFSAIFYLDNSANGAIYIHVNSAMKRTNTELDTMTRPDIHQQITDQIIAHLETGTLPWHKDWSGDKPAFTLPRRANGQYYQGINVLLLWMAAQARGFTADQWMTFKQAKAVGANVRKGERGTQIVYYSTVERENAEGQEVKIPFLKSYTVFNVQQIEGLPCDLTPDLFGDDLDQGAQGDAALDAFFAATGARIVNDGTQPRYNPNTDTVHMPRVGQFETVAGYYGTLAHELIHWTGHKSRLDRFNGAARSDYAFEELIAELGACFLCARVGADVNTANSAAYIGSWLRALRDDKRFIFKAASAAQKACDLIAELAQNPALAKAA